LLALRAGSNKDFTVIDLVGPLKGNPFQVRMKELCGLPAEEIGQLRLQTVRSAGVCKSIA
jgi:hypothetical protein